MRPGFSTYFPTLNTYTPTFTAESGNQPVMNAPSDSTPLLNRDEGISPIQSVVERMYPVKNLRDLTRRLQHTGRFTATVSSLGDYCVALPVAALMGLFPTTVVNQSANQHIMKMFLGVNGGCRLKIRSFDSSNHMIQYYPPTLVSPYSTSAVSPTDALLTSTVNAFQSSYITINRGSINGAPFMEIPSAWTADLKAAETGSVMDIHIPHTTMYHWWGGLGWTNSNETIEGYQTLMNNMGYLIITGIGTPNGLVDFESFMGLDDEARLGFHTQSPVLTIPIRQTGSEDTNNTYALPEVVPNGGTSLPIKYAQPKSLYFSTLNTNYNTVLNP